MQYPNTVQAAAAVGMDKKQLAESLIAEIPPAPKGRRPEGSTRLTVEEHLRNAAREIAEETGEVYEWKTLETYRSVALWVAGNALGAEGIPWADASWTAHVEAYGKGETFERFAADPTTKRRVRERNGGATGDVPAAARAINQQPTEAEKLVSGLDDAGREAVLEALEPWRQETPEDEARIREMRETDREIRDRDDNGDRAGSEHEIRALFHLQFLADHRHFARLRNVLQQGSVMLEGEQAASLTPEMFQ